MGTAMMRTTMMTAIMMVETVVEPVCLQIIALNVHALVETLELLIPLLEMVFAMMNPTDQNATMMVVTAAFTPPTLSTKTIVQIVNVVCSLFFMQHTGVYMVHMKFLTQFLDWVRTLWESPCQTESAIEKSPRQRG